MITNFKIFEASGKIKTVDYKIIIRDLKDIPRVLITDFSIVKSESGKSVIKAKGYEHTNISDDDYIKKKGWVAFDDFKDDKTRNVWHKNFENGTKKIKVYEI
jgi:hypothetical protein